VSEDRKDRGDFKDVFEWAAQIEEEDQLEQYEIEEEDKGWLREEAWKSRAPKEAVRRYKHEDVAWVEYYEIEKVGNKFRSVCKICGQVFYRLWDDTARGIVQTHILRDCKKPELRGRRIDLEEEPPF
jgi:hypothetical protein